MTRRTPSLVFLCVFTIGGFLVPAAKAEQVLSNERVRAEFNGHGLASIEDLASGKRFQFRDDSFSMVIDGKEVRSEALTAPTARKGGNDLTYRYASGSYTFEVVYELQPGWGFVSKQLFVTGEPGSRFRVDRVTPFRVTLQSPPRKTHVIRRPNPRLETKDYGAFLRFDDSYGLFVLVQNPFLDFQAKDDSFAIDYSPEMDWQAGYGPFTSDRGCLGPYKLTGRRLPEKMLAEWKLPDWVLAQTESGPDEGEIQAFTDCVRAFLLQTPTKPVRIHVGWCENDYQINIDTPGGREELRRILDRAAELGAKYVLTAPANYELARRDDSADDWKWEYLLWLGLGEKIRKGEWNPASDPIPASVQQTLDDARSRDLKLIAYVYPVMPFSQNPDWLVQVKESHATKYYANLGFRSFQDWLIKNLLTFYRRTGIGGFSFDYTFLWYPGTSRYAQWWGWRRVMETLREEAPEIVIDGRQLYQRYGPWIWLAGSYPHPTSNDEQPESFTPFPDLHFDRVSADRERYTAYWYRNYEFCPTEIMPGYFTHQTPRNDEDGEMPHMMTAKWGEVLLPFRRRDWDYLGWRYSVISSIATAGWNNVIDMIPARDPEEFRHFSEADKQWFRHWLDWADQNRDYLRNTRNILGQPAIGKVDGTSALVNGKGYLFLFNPNFRKLSAEFVLDESIGLDKKGRFLLKEVYPVEGRLMGKPDVGVWSYGDKVSLSMDGTSALVVQVDPVPEATMQALLFNVPGNAALADGLLSLTGVRGEVGTELKALVLLSEGAAVKKVTLNGKDVEFKQAGRTITVPVRFAGAYCGRSQQVGEYSATYKGGDTITGSFTIPARVFEQLAARKKAWPIPWTKEDLKTTWLAPERLLLFVQFAEPEDSMNVQLRINGQPVELTKAYSSIRTHPPSFVGFYADVSSLQPDKEYHVGLTLPTLKPGQFQGLFFDNVETEYTEQIAQH